ncbi:MAG TPA: hypothetical protein VFF94_11460, partial [Novosphingobium sp.]|nr:hypothetical protein [Novosphingobium sp.]
MTAAHRHARPGARPALLARPRAALLAGLALLAPGAAHAAPPPIMTTVTDDTTGKADSDPLTFLHNWKREGALLGDMWGIRRDLSAHGITLTIQETSEVLGNASGGTHKSLDYDGL